MQKGFANIVYLIAGLIVLVLIGGAFYAGKISNQLRVPPLPKDTSSPEIKEETTDWKAYEYSSFLLKIPSGWQEGKSKNPIQFLNYTPEEPGREFSPELDKGKLKVEIYTNGTSKSLNDYISEKKDQNKENMGFGSKWKESDVKIDGQPAVKVKTTTPGFVIFTQHPDKSTIYEIAFALDFEKYEGLANQILSAFKFLSTSTLTDQKNEKATSVSNRDDWKTYTNNTYNFSFQYPKGAEVQEVSPLYLLVRNGNAANFYPIAIFFAKNSEGLSRREFFAKQTNAKLADVLPYINIKETSVGTLPALRIVQDKEYYKNQSLPYTNYVIALGGNIMEIVTNEFVGKYNGKSTGVVESKESNSLYQEILSTFKSL